MKIKEKKLQVVINIIMKILCVVIILIIGMSRISDNTSIKIVGDEYGYWAAGSWLAGFNWSEMTGITGYYGYGLGIIYAIILKYTTSQILAYKIAIILNSIFICGMFSLTDLTIKKLDKEKVIPDYIRILISLVANVYVSNVLFSQQTICENFLSLTICLLIYEYVCFYYKPSVIRGAVLMAISAFSVAIHLRSIGACFVTFCFVCIILLCYQKNISGTIKIIILTMIFISVVFAIKNVYQGTMIYNEISTNANDFSGMSWRIHFFTTKEGIVDFFCGLSGKIFYAITSSYGLILIPFILSIRSIKRRRVSIFESTCIFLCILFIVQVLIANFFISTGTRFDGLMYGRYFSQTMSPLIAIGLYGVYKEKQELFNFRKKKYFFLICLYLLLTKFIEWKQDYSLVKNAVYGANTFFYRTLVKHNYKEGTILLAGITTLIIILLFVVAYSAAKKYISNIAFLCFLVFISFSWIRLALFAFDNGLSYGKIEPVQEIELADYIKKQNMQEHLVFYAVSFPSADPLQFLLKESTIHVISSPQELNEYNGYYVLTPARESVNGFDEERYELLYESSWLRLWQELQKE